MKKFLSNTPFILSEAAICERLRREDSITLHPTLFNTPLIYDEEPAAIMAGITRGYIDIAREFDVPIAIAAPTWRLDAGRVAAAHVPAKINRDAVNFIQKVKRDSGYDQVLVFGLMAPKNDCYDPSVALAADEAETFHSAQARELSQTNLDFLLAQTIPSISEAEGIARAMLSTGLPAVVSFCINREGQVLDGTPLDDAIDRLDEKLDGRLLGYFINCSHPSFLQAHKMRDHSLSRLLGICANASARDHGALEQSDTTVEDNLDVWADAMTRLHQYHGIKVLGGCCGTDDRYLRAICERVCENGQRTTD